MSHLNTTLLSAALQDAYHWGGWAFSLCNRDPSSPEFGCFDRYFWHYRTEREFPAATYQYLVLALACLYLDPRSPWHGHEALKEWTSAGCRFWASMQRSDGTFDEWLPHEQSHVATAFSMAMITEALLLFRDAGEPLDLDKSVYDALEKAGAWLSRHHDAVVLNHTAGAAAALGNLRELTGDARWQRGCDAALDVLAAHQSAEGWFSEYGGADPGYTSVSIDFLAKYWRRSGDTRAAAMVGKALSFFAHFVHPDGTVGGVYGSRNTRYLLPHGLFLFRHLQPAAAALQGWAEGRTHGRGLLLHCLDDRYRGFFLANHLQTLLELGNALCDDGEQPSPEPCRAIPQEVYFPEAGMVKAVRGDFVVLCNIRKSCLFEVYYDERFSCADAGYVLCFGDGTRATSQWFDPQATSQWNAETGEAYCSSRMAKIKKPNFFHRALLPHRVLSHVVGGFGQGGAFINEKIKATFVKPRQYADASLHRQVTVQANGVEVLDTLTWDRPCKQLFWSVGWGQMHVPSSNFHVADREGGSFLDISGLAGVKIRTVIESDGIKRSVL